MQYVTASAKSSARSIGAPAMELFPCISVSTPPGLMLCGMYTVYQTLLELL